MGLGVLPRTTGPSPSDGTRRPAGLPSQLQRAPPLTGNDRVPALASGSTAAGNKPTPKTKVIVGSASSDFIDDGTDQRGGAGRAVGKQAVLTPDRTEFWESEDEEPWLQFTLSQLDLLTELAIAIDPDDGPDDMLPELVEVRTGVSVRGLKI